LDDGVNHPNDSELTPAPEEGRIASDKKEKREEKSPPNLTWIQRYFFVNWLIPLRPAIWFSIPAARTFTSDGPEGSAILNVKEKASG
jgi:hypothetical protein